MILVKVWDPVSDSAETLTIPVEKALLGHMLNVFGSPVDGEGPIKCEEKRSVMQPPIPLSQRSFGTEIFQTGINTF